MKRLLNSYGWDGAFDLLYSFFPSIKSGNTLLCVSVAYLMSSVEYALGFPMYTLYAFCVAAIIELASGIYASVGIKGERFDSFKAGRFIFKFILLMGGLYFVNQLRKDTTNLALQPVFDAVYVFLFSYGALEYLISILENKAVIEGKEKDYYSALIKDKVQLLFKNFGKNKNDNGTN
jgi:hypothetical protein